MLFVNANQFEQKNTTISNTTKTTATIPIGKLSIGQSGVIVHEFQDNKSLILLNAVVINSSKDSSTIQFVETNILKQSAIPTTNKKPSNGDTFVLNHLWTTSLLIAPNFEAKNRIENAYYLNNFIDIDIFAAWLKINNAPVPTKNDFQEFTQKNNIGTLFIQLKNKLYIVDSTSFKVIHERDITIEDKTKALPFFTNVQDIKKGLFSWFSQNSIKNYNNYYENLIGINNDRK
jgi:hypothetical protein